MVRLRLIAILRDSAGNPLPNKEVIFYYKDVKGFIEFDRKITDINGKAETIYNYTGKNVIWFKAVFQGDQDYEYSEAIASYRPRSRILNLIPLIIIGTVVIVLTLTAKKHKE